MNHHPAKSPPNKGWGRKGEDAHMAKLRDEQVIAARAAYAHGATTHEIAVRLGVTVSTVRLFVPGKTWKHLPGAVPLRRGRGGSS